MGGRGMLAEPSGIRGATPSGTALPPLQPLVFREAPQTHASMVLSYPHHHLLSPASLFLLRFLFLFFHPASLYYSSSPSSAVSPHSPTPFSVSHHAPLPISDSAK